MTSPRDYLLEPEQMGGRGNSILRALSNAPQQYQESRARNEALQKALYENMIKKAEAQHAEKNEEQKLLERELQNRILKPKAERANEITAADLLHQQNLARLTGEQANYYAPNIQSEIAARQATTNRTSQMTPLEIAEQKIKNQYLAREKEAELQKSAAQSEYYKQGGGKSGVGLQELRAIDSQLRTEHPEWDDQKVDQASSAYLLGNMTLPNGESLPPPSGKVNSLVQQNRKRGSTTALVNQSAQLDDAVNQLSSVDISIPKKFTGAEGIIKLNAQKAKAAANLPTSKEYNDYVYYQNQVILNMDSLRKALGTTVQPRYVKEFLGKITDPNNSIWNNPETVEAKYKATLDWIKAHAKDIRTKAVRGATAELEKPEVRNSGVGNEIDYSHLSDAELQKIAGGG